jgi:DNA-binding Lrp family transcriptional regulator
VSRADEPALIAAIQEGLPLVERPFLAIAERLGGGLTEQDVIERIRELLRRGLIKRWGVVVRHHELGYRANAMVVWDVPDETIDELGGRLKRFPFVTLCYRRPRRLPQWPYNLFCMIHGRDRATVLGQIEQLVQQLELHAVPRAILFSRRRFKQCGARYAYSSVTET